MDRLGCLAAVGASLRKAAATALPGQQGESQATAAWCGRSAWTHCSHDSFTMVSK